jgi:hypothetical protein
MMAGLPLTPRLRGLRLAFADRADRADSAAALALFERVFALSPDHGDGTHGPRLPLGGPWLELRDAPGDTLALQCGDLARQRTHLQRLGIEPLDGAALGCTPCLRLEAVDTGACAVDLQQAPPPMEDTARGAARLCGLTLSVRSPERVALHWAQLFHAQPARNPQGLPAVALDGIELRFALAADGRTAVAGIDLGVDDLERLLREGTSRGVALQREGPRGAAFDALGIRFVLRPGE